MAMTIIGKTLLGADTVTIFPPVFLNFCTRTGSQAMTIIPKMAMTINRLVLKPIDLWYICQTRKNNYESKGIIPNNVI